MTALTAGLIGAATFAALTLLAWCWLCLCSCWALTDEGTRVAGETVEMTPVPDDVQAQMPSIGKTLTERSVVDVMLNRRPKG